MNLFYDPEDYLLSQESCGIKIGDTVCVVSKSEHKIRGWQDYWASKMDDMVGKTYKVDKIYFLGISLYSPEHKRTWNFPYFVLRKI